MVNFHSILSVCITFIGLSYGQFGPINVTRAFNTSVEVSSSIFVTHTFSFIASDPDTIALYNISIDFEDGECVNPSVIMDFESIDHNSPNEGFFVFYDSFNNDSLIDRCPLVDIDDTECGSYFRCLDGFEPPAGTYTQLLFFIATEDDLDPFCADEELENPTGLPVNRTLNTRWIVQCEANTTSLCTSLGFVAESASPSPPEDEAENGGGSSSEESADAVRELGHMLEEEYELKENEAKHDEHEGTGEEVLTLQFDDDTCNNCWGMFVVSVCFCIASCGLNLCLLYQRK